MSKQKPNTCRISKVPKGIYGRTFYEVRCSPKKENKVILFDTTTKKEASKTAKRAAKKYKIKKIYYIK